MYNNITIDLEARFEEYKDDEQGMTSLVRYYDINYNF